MLPTGQKKFIKIFKKQKNFVDVATLFLHMGHEKTLQEPYV